MKSYLDMSKSNLFYIAGLGIMMMASVLQANIPQITLSHWFEFQYHRQTAAGLFFAATLLGMFCVARYQARSKEPWRVPQSQISIAFVLFLVIGLLGIFVSR